MLVTRFFASSCEKNGTCQSPVETYRAIVNLERRFRPSISWSSRTNPRRKSSTSIRFAPRSPALKRAANTICFARMEKASIMSLKYHENRAMLLKTSKLLLGRLSDSQHYYEMSIECILV